MSKPKNKLLKGLSNLFKSKDKGKEKEREKQGQGARPSVAAYAASSTPQATPRDQQQQPSTQSSPPRSQQPTPTPSRVPSQASLHVHQSSQSSLQVAPDNLSQRASAESVRSVQANGHGPSHLPKPMPQPPEFKQNLPTPIPAVPQLAFQPPQPRVSYEEPQTSHRLNYSSGSAVNSETELEEIVNLLRDGTIESRSLAAERLFNKAAEDETARQRTASLNVVQPLVRLLYDGKERGRMYAAYALSSIMTPTQPLVGMRAAGVIPALITVLTTSGMLASKKGAMRALGRLARSEEAAVEIVEANGLAPIIALLDCDDAGLVRRCLVALYFIGADKDKLQAAMTEKGAVSPVVRLCRSSQAEIQAEAADVAKVLARNGTAASIIVDCGGLDALAFVASSSPSERARTSAVKAIQRISGAPGMHSRVMSSEAAKHLKPENSISGESQAQPEPTDIAIRTQNNERNGQAQGYGVQQFEPAVNEPSGGSMVNSLVEMLGKEDIQGQNYAANTLSKIATDTSVQEQMVTLGALPKLIAILRDNVGAGPAAAGALEKLSGQHRYAATIIQLGGVTALVGLLNAGAHEAFLPTMRSLRQLSGLDPDVAHIIVKAGGRAPLVRRSAKGSTDVRVAALTVLRDIAKAGHSLLDSGGVAVLAALEHSSSHEVRTLSTSTLSIQASVDSQTAVQVIAERQLQERMGALVSELRVSCMVPYALEEAFRMVPRSCFLPQEKAGDGFKNKSVRITAAELNMSSPSVDALAMQALAPEVGHSFLDIGSGTGFLTMLAAHMVAYGGTAVGVDLREAVVEYAEARCSEVKEQRGLMDLSMTFLRGSVFGHPSLPVMGKFDRIHVGANCPKGKLRDLLRLLKPGGKMVVVCESQLLLLVQPAGGPVPEPIVLGAVPASTDALIDDGPPQAPNNLFTGNRQGLQPGRQEIFTSPSQRHAGVDYEGNGRNDAQQNGNGLPSFFPPIGPNVQQETDILQKPSQQEQQTPKNADEDHGWLISRDDIRICRNTEGRKCRLGEGGFGVVYKALMNGVDEVAVKLVKADRPTQKEMSLFQKEVRVLRQLHHKNIVQFYGANLDVGSMFFVTELMKGGDLYSALRHHPETMRWDRLGKKVALDTALGINYLHKRKPPMMHRDLKSPNVLLSEEGVAKIADVGMVRSQVKDLVTAQPVMTPLWAAPEVIRHERASVKADMWSYGVLIWELVSGQDITEMQPLAVARQVPAANRQKTLELPPNCPSIARYIFEACTQMSPDDRPTASKVVEWLRHPGL